MKNISLALIVLLIIALGGIFLLRSRQSQPKVPKKEVPVMREQRAELKLTSPVFEEGETIPDKYTCSGGDVNPPLEIFGASEETESLVLIMDDPDAPAGTWDHWILFNIDPTVAKIEENSIPSSALLGKNSFGKRAYGGPCPPPGPAHHYNFKLYALDTKLDLEAGIGKEEIEKAMEEHTLAQTQLTGLYGR